MKKLLFTFFLGLSVSIAIAQVPNLINYQAVARNNSGQALASQTIKVRLSIMKNAVLQYSETRQVVTNALGLFNVQIGGTNAISTTGDMSAIDWLNNAAPGYMLKVELDINNTGLFTDMGSQQLLSVPFALGAAKATTAVNVQNINNRPIDQAAVPVAGDRLVYDGSKWTSVKKDSVFMVAGQINNITAGGGNAPWTFVINSSLPQITVTGNETIVATFTGSFGHGNTFNTVPVSIAACYQNVSSGAIFSFDPNNYPDVTIHAAPIKTQLSATGAIKLPAGTYRIGMAIKNKSTNNINLSANDYYNGTIEIRY